MKKFNYLGYKAKKSLRKRGGGKQDLKQEKTHKKLEEFEKKKLQSTENNSKIFQNLSQNGRTQTLLQKTI